MAIPWEEAIAAGTFNVRQALALRDFGWDVIIFKPIPAYPAALERYSKTIARWTRHPERYSVEGIPVYAPRVRFTFVSHVRFGLVAISPATVATWFRRAVQPAFDQLIERLQPDAVLAHSTIPWGALTVPSPLVFVDRSARDAQLWLSRRGTKRLLLRFLTHAEGHFTSGRTIQELFNQGPIWNETQYLPNGVIQPSDAQRTKPRPIQWNGDFVILCVGSFIERKGHRVLIRAFARLEDSRVRLVLVGQPPEELMAEIERLGIAPRVSILPQMPQRELLQYMVWADVFALPSWAEAFGNVYAESMASGTPVIMTSDSGMAREITHGKHGWIVQPRSVESLYAALADALSADLTAMGRAGRQHVESKFSWERNAKQVSEVLLPRLDNSSRLQQ